MTALENSKHYRLIKLLTIGLILPTIVAIISHFIEYGFFQNNNQAPKPAQVVTEDEPRIAGHERPPENNGLENKGYQRAKPYMHPDDEVLADKREFKVLPFRFIQQEYNWATRLLGWFFVILPALLALFADEGSSIAVGCLFGIIPFLIYWVIATVVILIFYLPLIYFLGTWLEFDGLVYAVKIYEGWVDSFVHKL